MNIYEIRNKIQTEDDYIATKRFGYSLKKLMERYGDGCPDNVIAQALALAEAEVEELYQLTVIKLRGIIGVES